MGSKFIIMRSLDWRFHGVEGLVKTTKMRACRNLRFHWGRSYLGEKKDRHSKPGQEQTWR